MIYLNRLICAGSIVVGSLAIGVFICQFQSIYPNTYQLARNEGLERYQTQLESLLDINQGHYQSLPASDPLYNILQHLPFSGNREASLEQLGKMILQSNSRAIYWAAQLTPYNRWRKFKGLKLLDFDRLTLLQMAAANKDPYAARDLARIYQCGAERCQNFWLNHAIELFTEKANQGDYRAKYELRQLNITNDHQDAVQLDDKVSFAIDAAKHQFYYPLETLLVSYLNGHHLPVWVDTSYFSNQAYLSMTDKKLMSKLVQWLTDRQYIVDRDLIKIAQKELNQDDYHRLFIQYTLLGKPTRYRDIEISSYYTDRILSTDAENGKKWAIEAMALFEAMELSSTTHKDGIFSERTQYFYDRDIKYHGINFDKEDFKKISKLSKEFKKERSHNIYLTPNNTYLIPDL
uniref:Uncharacterized protein n=1 Tax=Marinomonas sp. (strain MWYL1) TaxID=400668 RepID=A6W0P2_MARMS